MGLSISPSSAAVSQPRFESDLLLFCDEIGCEILSGTE